MHKISHSEKRVALSGCYKCISNLTLKAAAALEKQFSVFCLNDIFMTEETLYDKVGD